MSRKYTAFREFYPFYLSEHANRMNRRLHFIGLTLALVLVAVAVMSWRAWPLAVAFILGYGFAWAGHHFFEKNRPATFKYPFYSFMGDWVMYKDVWTGKIRI